MRWTTAIRCSSRPAILAMTTLCMARTTRLWTVGSWTRPVCPCRMPGRKHLICWGRQPRWRKFCWAISWRRSKRRRKKQMNFLPRKQKKPLRQIYPQSLRSRFCGVKATSCRTVRLCRCPWQTASLKNWTPPSTQNGKRTVTRAAGTTRPHSALILP